MEKKYHNLLLITSLLVSVCLLSFDGYYFFIKRGVTPQYYIKKFQNKPVDDVYSSMQYQDLKEEYRLLNQEYKNKFVTVFVGDSITKRFNIQEFTHDRNILNRGVFSDTTQGLLYRWNDTIDNLNIDKMFLMIGYNDLKYRTDEEIIENIKKLLSRSKAHKVYLQSLLPVNAERTKANRRIIDINKRLLEIAKSKGYTYIDLYSCFLGDNGGINPQFSRDGIHPNYFGYKKWFSIINPLL